MLIRSETIRFSARSSAEDFIKKAGSRSFSGKGERLRVSEGEPSNANKDVMARLLAFLAGMTAIFVMMRPAFNKVADMFKPQPSEPFGTSEPEKSPMVVSQGIRFPSAFLNQGSVEKGQLYDTLRQNAPLN